MPPKQAERAGTIPAGSLGQLSDRPQGYRFMNDPGMIRALDNVANLHPAFPPARSRSRRSGPSHRACRSDGPMDLRRFIADGDSNESDEGGKSDDSLLGPRKKQRRETRRRTKAQREAEAIAPLMRPMTEFPPEMRLTNQEILKLGAAGVGELEKEKVGWKSKGAPELVPIKTGGGFDPDQFNRVDLLIDKHDRRMNRTDLSTYKRKRQSLGLDDEDIDYNDDPVLYAKRDDALKASADYMGNQHRASHAALGESASPIFIRSSTFGPSRQVDEASKEPSARGGLVSPNKEHPDEVDGGIDSLFEDIDEVENRIAPGDVEELGSPNRSQHYGDHDAQEDEAPIITEFTWTQAEDWAKTLWRVHGNDFFDSDKLDEGKILQTANIEKSDALKSIENEAVAIKIEQEDELFFAMAEEEERRDLERLEREKRRAPLIARHFVGQNLFEQLREAVVILVKQREQQKRLMAREDTAVSPATTQRSRALESSSGTANVSLRLRQPPAQPHIVLDNDPEISKSPDTDTSVLTLADRRDLGRNETTDRRDRLRIDAWLAASQREGGIDSNQKRVQDSGGSRSEYRRRNRHAGSRGAPSVHRSVRDDTPGSNHHLSFPNGKKDVNDQRRNDASYDRNRVMGPPRDPRHGYHNARGKRKGGSYPIDRRSYTPSNASSAGRDYSWGNDRNKATTNDHDDYVPWNPSNDDLDPIKAQFGG